MDVVYLIREALIGFIGERGSDNCFDARASGGISQKSRISPVTGDNSKLIWRVHSQRIAMTAAVPSNQNRLCRYQGAAVYNRRPKTNGSFQLPLFLPSIIIIV